MNDSASDDTLFDVGQQPGAHPDDRPVTIFTTPLARNTDPDTSLAAAASVRKVTETHRRILAILLGTGPMTDEQIGFAWRRLTDEKISPSGLRSRRAELVKSGLVEDSGEVARTESNRATIVWRISDAGRQVAS